MTETGFCKRFLLQDLAEKDQYQNIFDLITLLDPDLRPNPAEYDLRLDACRSCDQLISGMCRVCSTPAWAQSSR